MKTALVINTSLLGDIVTGSVVIDSLQDHGYEVAAVFPKYVHCLWDDRKDLVFYGLEDKIEKKFDLVVDLTSDKTSRKIVKNVRGKVKVGRVQGWPKRLRHRLTYTKMVKKSLSGHILEDFYPLLHFWGDQSSRVPKLTPVLKWPEKFQFFSKEQAIAIHIGANNPKRIIPEFLISAVIQDYHKRGYKIILIGNETDIAKKIVKNNDEIPLYAKLSLKEVKQVLSMAKLFIGADSGILHLAASLEVNSIGIYGPNLPKRSGPKQSTVSFFEKQLECRPCNQNVPCPIDVRCMNTLDKSELLQLISFKLG